MPRLAVYAVLLVASCLLITLRAEPAAADEKKDKTTIGNLEKQVAALKSELTRRQRNRTPRSKRTSLTQLAAPKPQNATLTQEVTNLKAANTRLSAIIDGYRGAGLVHVVVLKLRSDTSPGEAQAVIDDTYAQLSKIKPVRAVWAGKPTSKSTPDAIADYTVALVLLFDDAAGLKGYLNDPIHTKFADTHLKKWEAPAVYDYEPKKPAQ